MKIRQSLPYFHQLLQAPERSRIEMLKSFPIHVTDDLFEILYNVMMANHPLTAKDRAVIKKNENAFRKLISKRTRTTRRRHLHDQSGGFLGAVLPIALGVVSSLVGNL